MIDNRGQSAKQICGLVNPGMAAKEWGMMRFTLPEATHTWICTLHSTCELEVCDC